MSLLFCSVFVVNLLIGSIEFMWAENGWDEHHQIDIFRKPYQYTNLQQIVGLCNYYNIT